MRYDSRSMLLQRLVDHLLIFLDRMGQVECFDPCMAKPLAGRDGSESVGQNAMQSVRAHLFCQPDTLLIVQKLR